MFGCHPKHWPDRDGLGLWPSAHRSASTTSLVDFALCYVFFFTVFACSILSEGTESPSAGD
ncbi:uncharacterized protein CTRU02_214459 [Colletotrichum truncatum]|uniref:Uncharacterized protein n=1 Tax=Colletotrichum truncatum TaxID=5467 RepID=A0ACC3YES7_COLTU|nr:uncharacterized protein CTRU02_12129 [Colletotrichum truncatum]KAF6784918.1 hypothetical protein CTRU02_12129 [Colletotrichum truncatum]